MTARRTSRVWHAITGYDESVPAGRMVLERLACGHPGIRAPRAQVKRRIAAGSTRLCGVCTRAQQRRYAAESGCIGKTRYTSAAAAQENALRWQQQAYACPTCRGWHCASR